MQAEYLHEHDDLLQNTNHSWEFHQIYNLAAVVDKDEPFKVRGQKVKGQGYDDTEYGQKSHVQKCTFPPNE